LTPELGNSPPGANIRVRRNEHLQKSIRKNRRSYIPANHDNVLKRGDTSQLPVHGCPHLWHSTDRRYEAIYSRIVEGQPKDTPVEHDRTIGLIAYAALEDTRQAIVSQTAVRGKLLNIRSGKHAVQQTRVDEHQTKFSGHSDSH
jgi:hypothetical protein